MWMHVGSRAFFTGASQRVKKQEDESKKKHPYLDGISKLRLASMNSLSQVRERNYANRKSDCVVLSNPTMNELMETIKAKSTPNLNNLIVVGNIGGGQRLIVTPQRDSEKYKNSSEELNEPSFHRAYSADDISQLTKFSRSRESLLRIRSEGTLVPLPGIDSNLSKQMATLYPFNNESFTESAVSLINGEELEGGFINISSDSSIADNVNDKNKYMGLIPCTCCLCLSRPFDLRNGIDYQVKQAKQIIKEAVEAARNKKERQIRIPQSNISESLIPFESIIMTESLTLGTTLYFISLAHLLLIIACLRGIF